MGTSIAYFDVTEAHRLQDQLDRSKRELEQAYEELQSTVEELETTNEELQSTNEELETTNEELQSTNEELETMNEELQSSNEELETMNDELRHRTQELNDVNSIPRDDSDHDRRRGGGARPQPAGPDLEQQGPGAMGANGRRGRGRAPDVAGHRLAGRELRQQMRDTLVGRSQREEVVLEATNRRGKAFMCRVTFLPLGSTGDGNGSGVIMMMEDVAS